MDDSSGLLRLRQWVDGVRALPAKQTPGTVAQRLVFPGFEPIAGKGLISVGASGQPVAQLGEGAQWATVVNFVSASGVPEVDVNERDALFGALLTVASDRRCQLIPEIVAGVEGREQKFFIPVNVQTDDTLTAPIESWPRVTKTLSQHVARLLTMDEDDAIAITCAIHMHYGSALLFTRDLTGAYALAVGGVEALAARFGKEFNEWHQWDRARSWDKFFTKIGLDDEQSAAFRERLLATNDIRLTERFTSYFCDNLASQYWNERVRAYTWAVDAQTGDAIEGAWYEKGRRSEQFAADPAALRKAARGAYKRRSLYVHAGERPSDYQEEYFGIGPGRVRDSLSYAQLRAGLRTLILKELTKRGKPDFPDVDRFVVGNNASPKSQGSAFFRKP